jgi:Ring finger domain
METILHEQEQHQCPICMEYFAHDELVSWSPSTECDHVFHHSCIKTWLLHHERCPNCRVIILSVDRRKDDVTPASTTSVEPSVASQRARSKRIRSWRREQLDDLAQQRHQRIFSTYFCIEEGLVLLDRSLAMNLADNITTGDKENDGESLKRNNRKKEISFCTMRRFLTPDIRADEMIALRTHPKSILSTNDIVVTISSPNNDNAGFIGRDAVSHAQQLEDVHSANDVVDIEMAMKALPVISNDITDIVFQYE